MASDVCQDLGLTKSQAQIFALLSDDKPHTKVEIQQVALGKRHAAQGLVSGHIARMRPKLAVHGFRIIDDRAVHRSKGIWRLARGSAS